MNETINKATGETIKYNRIGGTPDNPIYFNDPVPTQTQPLNQTPTAAISATTMTQGTQPLVVPKVTPNPVYNELARDVGTRTQSQIDIATQEAEALQRAGGNQADQARQALSSEVQKLFTQRGDLAGSQATLEEQAGIGEEQKNLREVNTEIANTNVQLRAEQDRIRNTPMSAGQKAVETGNLQDTFGRRLADLAIRQSAAQGNITAIQQDVERKLKIALAPIDNKLEYFKTFGKDNVDALTAKEKDKLSLIQSSLQDQKKKVEELEKAKGQAILEVVNNGGGNDKAVLQAIQGATDLSGVYSAGGKYIGALDRQIKQQQINKLIADSTTGLGNDIKVSEIQTLQGLPAESKNTMIISSFLKNNKIGAGTRTKLADILGVINATSDLAQNRQTTGFKGISPLNTILDAKIPLTDIGIPFRNTLMSKEGIENRQYLEAVNLKVQQWASGAALTTAQTEQVGKFTPRPTDTDAQIRTKINGLVNFMNSQVKSSLQSEGIAFEPEKVNLFETYDLLKEASPEQLAELKSQGLIK